MRCESCGMPMAKPDDFGGRKKGNKYCCYCTDSEGSLKSRKDVREGIIQFRVNSTGKPRSEVERDVDWYMTRMPAWKKP